MLVIDGGSVFVLSKWVGRLGLRARMMQWRVRGGIIIGISRRGWFICDYVRGAGTPVARGGLGALLTLQLPDSVEKEIVRTSASVHFRRGSSA